MKKIIAVALAAFALNASAYSGNGNERIEQVRNYLKAAESGIGNSEWYWFLGVVSGLSDAFADPTHPGAICYPETSNSAQLADIAAKYIVDHPEKRADSLGLLVLRAHLKAFGLQMVESCGEHDEWLQYNS